MKCRALVFLEAVLLLGGGGGDALGKVRVAATVPDLAAIAQAVGRDRAEVLTLTLPTQDPHFADAKPHLALKLNQSDLLLVVGLDLEIGWLPVLITGARNPRIQSGADGCLDLSSVVRLKEVPTVRVDRSQGDIHPGGNPHYLVDPENAILVAKAIAARLTRLDPSGSSAYAENLRRFSEELARARVRWREKAKPFAGMKVVPYHKSWVYLTDFLGLVVVDHLEPKPGIPPSSAHVLQIIRTIQAQKVPLMIQEEYYPDRTAKLIAEKTGATLVVLPGGADLRKGEGYVQRMDRLVGMVLGALGSRRGR
jgi:zinc/manganese transport system substrate-binding protein